MAGFFRELWNDKVLQALIRKMQEKQYIVNTITDYTPFTSGSKASGYNGPLLDGLTVQSFPVTTPDDPSRGAISFSFNQKRGVVFTVSDIDLVQSDVNQIDELADQAAELILDDYDAFILKSMIADLSATSGFKNTIADTTNSKITFADFLDAKKKLDLQKAPRRSRTCAIHPLFEGDLYHIPEFISRDKIADTNAIKEGVIGRILGFDVISTADLPLVKSSWAAEAGATLPVCLFYSSAAFGFGRQKEMETKSSPDAKVPGDTIAIYSVYGGTTQKDNYMIAYRKDK